MDLWHSHGHTAADRRNREQRLQSVRLEAHGTACPANGLVRYMVDGRWSAHEERQRQHRNDAEYADTDMGLTPTHRFNEILQNRRPYGASEVVARRRNRDRNAATSS